MASTLLSKGRYGRNPTVAACTIRMSTDAINQQIQELERLRRQIRRSNLATVFALALIVIVGVGAIVNSLYGLTHSGPKQDQFLVHFGGQLQTNVLPVAQRFAEASVRRLRPVLETELRGLDDRAPQLAEVALTELSKLSTNLPTRAGRVLENTVGKALQEREARLRRLYPGVSEQHIASLMENLHAEAQAQLTRTGEKLFKPHVNSIQGILANLDKIESTEPLGPANELDSWQVAFLFLDVFTHEFKDLGFDDTKPQETKQ